MLTKLIVGASALVLAGGAFMTAQALTSSGQDLPQVNAPLTVHPAGTQTTQTSRTGPAPTTSAGSTAASASTGATHPSCRDDDATDGPHRHGHGSDDSSRHGCHQLETVVPPPSVFTDDHGRHGEAESGDDHGGHGEVEPGDDHGGHGEVEPGDDHGGSSGSDDSGGGGGGGGGGGSGSDDSGGGSSSDDHGGRG